jgi:hypothetical protein
MLLSTLIFVCLGSMLPAAAQNDNNPTSVLTITEDDMEDVRPPPSGGSYTEQLVGDTVFAHSFRVRNNTFALPPSPRGRQEVMNETHYFGPLVNQPVAYQRPSEWGSYIMFRAPEFRNANVVLATSFAASEGYIVVTGEDAYCTGREGRQRNGVGKGAASGYGSIAVAVLSAGLVTSFT